MLGVPASRGRFQYPTMKTRREFVRILFMASQAAVAGRFLSSTALAEATPAGALNFLAFGDWGRGGQREQLAVAAQMAAASRAVGAKFIISVGDNFYNDGVTGVDDRQWRTSFEDVYKDEALQLPWNAILGNHDYRGNCDAQVDYSRGSKRWKMPARYYMESLKVDASTTADFFYVDTSPFLKGYYKDPKIGPNVATQDVPKQLAWLKDSLAASKAQWKLVIGHHPIYSGGTHGETKELVEKLLPLLQQYKVQAYFNGHDHNLEHLIAGDIHLFDTGAGSLVSAVKPTERTKFGKSVPGFVAVSLQPAKMDVRMIDYHGMELYAATVPVGVA